MEEAKVMIISGQQPPVLIVVGQKLLETGMFQLDNS